MRCKLLPTETPSPAFAEWSAMISNPAGLSAGQLAVISARSTLHVCRVVVEKEKCDEIQVAHVCGQRDVEDGQSSLTIFLPAGVLVALRTWSSRARPNLRDFERRRPRGGNCAGHQFLAVSATCAHIQYLHARTNPREG